MSSESHHADGSLPGPYSLSSGRGDKTYSRLHFILGQAVMCAILLPTAAQSIVGFLWVSTVLKRTGIHVFRPAFWKIKLSQLAPFYRILLWSLGGLWASHFFSLLLELTSSVSWSEIWPILKLHLHLLTKQGLYGIVLIVCFVSTAVEQRNSSLQGKIPKFFISFSFILTLYMLGQRYWGWDWVHGIRATLGEHRFAYGVYRASGWMGHPLSMAFNSLIIGLLTLSHGLWLRQTEKGPASPWFVVSTLSFLQIWLSGSRYPLLLMLMFGFLLLAWSHRALLIRKKIWFLYGSLSFFMILILAFGVDPNLRGRLLELSNNGQTFEESFDRLIFWKVNLSLGLDHPLGGAGLFRYPSLLLDYYHQASYTYYERKYAAHNIFIQTFADMGLVGCVGLLTFLVGLGWMGWKLMRWSRHTGLVTLSLVIVTSGLMQNNLRDSEFLFALWASIGLTLNWLVEQGMASEPTESRTNFQDYQS